MEIVSGILRGMQLRVPAGTVARPTAVRAREALFASLGPLDGMCVADLFAGTGALGLEAASRGASSVLFVDSARSSCNAIRANCAKAEAISDAFRLELLSGELPNCVKRLVLHAQPDLIVADPPYAESAELLNRLLNDSDFTAWSAKALLIWEAAAERGGLQQPPSTWKLETIRNFGRAKFLYLRPTP